MQLREYARVLWHRGWIILLIAAVGAVGAFGFSKLVTPIYRSTMTLSAVPARPDYGLSLTVKDLLHNYSQQIITTHLTQEVIDKLQLDIKPEKLKSEVTVAPDEANLLIVIEVKDPLQANAPKIAQALADAFVLKHSQDNLIIDQRDRILVDLHDGPTPVEQFFPNTRINVAAGGILGALVGFFTVFLLEYLESANLRTAEDVEKALGVGITVLGAIPPFTPDKKVKPGTGAQPVTASR